MTQVRSRQGVSPAADELIARYYDRIFNLAFRTLGRREDAEDIAQQTFLRALPRLGDLRAPGAAGAWLCRIATNLCLDFLRSHQREGMSLDVDVLGSTPLPDPDRLTAPAQAAELREERLAVWRATLALPPEQRMALALRELHAMSYAEIAESMGKSVTAVETLLFRARVGFRQAFEVAPLQTDGPCRPILELLSASIDRELDCREQARIDAHVPTCPTCRFAARELRATSRLYGLIPIIMPTATKVTVASLLVGAVGGAAGGGVLVSTAGVAPTLLSSGIAATVVAGIWSGLGASAVGTTVAAVIAFATVSTTSMPAAAMSPPPRVAPASLVAGRPQWHAESAENPPMAGAAQPDGPQPADSDGGEASNAARPRNAAPPATPGVSATPDPGSVGAPSTANPASVADQSAAVPTGTPGTEAHAPGTSSNAADTIRAHSMMPSATDGQRGAMPPSPVSADSEEPDAVLSKATTEGAVAVGRQASAPEPERKPTLTSPDVSGHAAADVARPPMDDSSRSKVVTEPEEVSHRPSGDDDEQEVIGDPTSTSRGNRNSAAPRTANSNATQDGQAPVDKGSAPSKVGASNGNGDAHAAADPKANDAASPTPGSSNSKANGNGGNGNGNGNGAAHTASDPKTNGIASPAPSSSNANGANANGKGNAANGNDNAHAASDPKVNGEASRTPGASNAKGNAHAAPDPNTSGAASPTPGSSNSKANGNGGNGNGAAHAGADAKAGA